ASTKCGDADAQVVVTKATPHISTTLSAASIVLGGQVTDTATISGGFQPTGSVSWNVYAASDTSCQTPLNSSPLTGSLSGGSASSPSYTPTAPGTYQLVASYGGDQDNETASTKCGDAGAQVVVTKATPHISTTLSAASIVLGGQVTDTATISGGFQPTGSVSWNVYAASDTSCQTPLNSSPLTGSLSGGSASSPSYTPTAPGTYQLVASYGGDQDNETASTKCGDAGAQVVVTKATPHISTTLSAASIVLGGQVTDTATISGGFQPTGSVSWNVYAASDTSCQTPLNSSPLTGSLSGGSASSPSYTPTAPGTYQLVASYGGDQDNETASTKCGDAGAQVVVTKATPHISTTLSAASIVLGGQVTDTATISGGFQPTGSVSWNVYAASDTSCQTPLNSSPLTGSLSGGSASSPSYTPTAPGTYQLVASYGGDQDNETASTKCGDAGAQVVVTKATPHISTTLSAASIVLGGQVTDTATISGGFQPTGSVSWNVYAASDTSCQTPLNSSPLTGSLSGGSASSPSYTPTAPGTYQLVASYGGDQNNETASTKCGDAGAQVVVTKATPHISTTLSAASIVLGGQVTDTATISGGFQPTGSVSWNVYAASDTSCQTPLNSSPLTGSLSGGSASSPSYTPTAPGTYQL